MTTRRSILFRAGRFNATGATLRSLITLAYKVKDFQISGGPSWIDTYRYYLTSFGKYIITTGLKLKNLVLIPKLALARGADSCVLPDLIRIRFHRY